MNVGNQGFTSINQVRDTITQNQSQKTKSNGLESTTEAQSFESILKNKASATENVKFSKHASERLQTRNINMTDSQKERLQDATMQAKEKGMNESLVMVDNLAFIVNVKKNTVITAVNDVKQGAFTNIDGAIIN